MGVVKDSERASNAVCELGDYARSGIALDLDTGKDESADFVGNRVTGCVDAFGMGNATVLDEEFQDCLVEGGYLGEVGDIVGNGSCIIGSGFDKGWLQSDVEW